MLKLYNFFRSGTSHRLRIALNLKGLDYQYLPVDLRSEQHRAAEFLALNPQGLVPALVAEGQTLIQSPAIIEWLEERHPEPPLLPQAADERARVRALAALVGCDILGGNAQNGGVLILDFLIVITQGAGLFGAARRIVHRIKIQHQLFAEIIG